MHGRGKDVFMCEGSHFVPGLTPSAIILWWCLSFFFSELMRYSQSPCWCVLYSGILELPNTRCRQLTYGEMLSPCVVPIPLPDTYFHFQNASILEPNRNESGQVGLTTSWCLPLFSDEYYTPCREPRKLIEPYGGRCHSNVSMAPQILCH